MPLEWEWRLEYVPLSITHTCSMLTISLAREYIHTMATANPNQANSYSEIQLITQSHTDVSYYSVKLAIQVIIRLLQLTV